jgi:hypothetical protein
MQADPVEEWRRLSALYSEMGDIEIQELAGQINDLVPTAQDVLRDELKKRGVSAEGRGARIQTSNPEDDTTVHWRREHDTAAADPDLDPEAEGSALDYTWKVALCRCESLDEAAARSEMLRRAGIDCWIQRPGARFVVPWLELGVGDIQINVGADQLDQAHAIIAQPIPQEILQQLKEEAAEPAYELPTCPQCGAPDPTLESVEPSNNWLCESCDHTWSDPVENSTKP